MTALAAPDRHLCWACSPRAENATRIPRDGWPDVLTRATDHKVANLVLRRWAEVARGDLPPAVKSQRYLGVAANLAFAARLLEVLPLLDEHGIQALPFKGPLLAEKVFGDLGSRSFGDLDLLVPREDLASACDLLAREGYLPPNGVSLDDYVRITLLGGHHVGLKHGLHGTYVELHWEASGRYLPVALEFSAVRPYLERVGFQGREVWSLGPEAGLLYLCVHGAREYWRILDHVVCVAWHLDRRPPDWDVLRDLADRWGARGILLTGLGLASALFETALRDEVRDSIRQSRRIRRLIERQSRRIFAPDRLSTLRIGNLPEFLRMHWTQLADPVHFAQWIRLRLTAETVEDLAESGDQGKAARRLTALAPMQALRRWHGRGA